MDKNEKMGKKKLIVLAESGYSLVLLFCFFFFGFLGGAVLNMPFKVKLSYFIFLLISWVFLLVLFIVIFKQFKNKALIASAGACNWITIKLESRDLLDSIVDIKIINLSKKEE